MIQVDVMLHRGCNLHCFSVLLRLPSLPLNDAAASALKAAFATFCAGTRGDVERATVEAAGGGVVLRAASAVLQMCNGKAASR